MHPVAVRKHNSPQQYDQGKNMKEKANHNAKPNHTTKQLAQQNTHLLRTHT